MKERTENLNLFRPDETGEEEDHDRENNMKVDPFCLYLHYSLFLWRTIEMSSFIFHLFPLNILARPM